MINLTVKTLDSQNHAFSVEDEITIAQFKEKIADTVNIPADTQRLIYCGRVLQDTSLLKDYDVDGKVIHLVQRPPPSSAPHLVSEPMQHHPLSRVRGLEYVGTVRLPVSGIENTLHSLPMQSLANSRLNVARRMINRAENVLNALENPNRQDQPAQNEPQEEATPVFEARVVIPNSSTFSGTEETFASNNANPADTTITPPEVLIPDDIIETVIDPLANNSNDADQLHSVSSTPEVISPLVQSTENLATTDTESNTSSEAPSTTVQPGESTAPNNSATSTQTNSTGGESRTAEFADILDSLNRLHTRFAPFMDQYNTFMREDPAVPAENQRSTQTMLNRVSEICHYLGHAYHSVSDIILRVRTQTPRHLLCRPMLIQHSAVVQVDIPIQVEAQINIPADRNASTTATTTTTSASTTSSTTPSTETTAASTGVTSSSSDLPVGAIVGIPFMPRTSLRLETYQLPSVDNSNSNRNNNNPASTNRTGGSAVNNAAADAYIAAMRSLERSRNNANTPVPPTVPSERIRHGDVASAIASSIVNSLHHVTGINTGGIPPATFNTNSTTAPGATSNPNVEFFMEVTPESITIDSLETAFVGANQANELNVILQEGMNTPPSPEFIQTLIQMAGQLINRNNLDNPSSTPANTSASVPSTTTATSAPTPSAPPLDVSGSTVSDVSVTSCMGAARTTPFQNSQARGNTQTQPTTATHTRSTPRPHVHLAQHTMHAFDPFLPCNSHHILTRRRVHNANSGAQQNATSQPNRTPATPVEIVDLTGESPPVYSIIRNLLNTVRNTYSSTVPQRGASASPSTSVNIRSANLMGGTWMSSSGSEANYPEPRPTIARILQQFPDNPYVMGESIFTDLIMVLARGLTIGDLMHILRGRLDPLQNLSADIRAFTICRILDTDTSDAGYDRGVERLLAEMHLFIDHLAVLETRDNIDVVRSVQALLRARFPNIISLAISHNPSSTRLLFEQIKTTIQQLGALLVRASGNGAEGVQAVFEAFLMRFMGGVSPDLQHWSIQTTRPQLAEFIRTLEVPESLLQPYIVRHVDPVVTPEVAVENHTHTPEPEPMQVEELTEISSSTDEETLPRLHITEDNEPLPTVVLGSAPWHGQVPSDWVPIIVRDSQRQRRQNSQPQFSDAYLSGMPSKRRKLANCNKPPSSISQVISESVRHAVTATGLTAVAPIDTVSQAAASDVTVQSAYRDLLHSSVQSELENNDDFTPEQFPNVDTYFNNRRQ